MTNNIQNTGKHINSNEKRKKKVSTIMNAEGSPIQLCQQGHSCSSMGSRGGTDIMEVTITILEHSYLSVLNKQVPMLIGE